MRLRHALYLDGLPVDLVEADVRLELNEAGRAIFIVRGDHAAGGVRAVRYSVGLAGQAQRPCFLGVAGDAQPERAGATQLTCRGIAGALDRPARMALRHCTPADVLAGIEADTGLAFLLPAAADYLAVQLPFFSAGIGTWRDALAMMGTAWGVADAVWLPLPDGRVYWGGWSDGPFEATPLPLAGVPGVQRDPTAGTVRIPAIPTLRPGAVVGLERPYIVRSVRLAGPWMHLSIAPLAAA